ncbi:MAG: hypothetical protein LDL07_03195 [Desulfarculus sp.]|nr:hypothetical protein [Desulfarculus sp.]
MGIERTLRLGQIAELKEQLAEAEKRFKRQLDDVNLYTFPTNPLDAPGSCRIELASQAMEELKTTQALILTLRAKIAELEAA